ncbi:MAG TPA: SRPBCC domain-containing protein [Thermoplasmata archaeon]|nr:SRPBCC domain-containing protein [Thermoplasmata archaeon]
MKDQDYTISISVDESPEEAYDAINNPRGWWSESIEGQTDKLGAVWKYHYGDAHRCTMKVTGLVSGERVVWHVVDNYFDFTEDKTEWKGTDVIFDISRKGGKTEIRFTHRGLVPEYECYDICSNAWSSYIRSSLRDLIAKGKGHPNKKE